MAGQKVLGKTGAVIFALLVSAACLGSININVFTTARLTISAANKGYLPPELIENRYGSSADQPPRNTVTVRDARGACSVIMKMLALIEPQAFRDTPV